MLTAKLISTEDELIQVAELSRTNLVSNITEEIKRREGYVSWPYPLETLQKLHALSPSVIVKDGDFVAGYALHLKTGFTIIDTHQDEGGEWNVVVWDWS